MSKVKRIVALSLALVLLVAAMSISASAAVLHTYRAYQIFNAATNAEGSMGDIEWGSGVNATAFLSALKSAGLVRGTVTTADEVAEAVADYSDEQARQFAKLAYANKVGAGTAVTPGQTTLAPTGYYVVADETDLNGHTGEVNNIAVLKIAKGEKVEIEFKTDQPSLEKKVMDRNDSTNEQSDWQDSADYDIGDEVPFCLDAQLATITDYDTYKLVFHDTLSAGLTYSENSAKFYVVHNGTQTPINAPANIAVSANGQNIDFTVNDVRATNAVNGDIIRVIFSATLNSNALIGPAGNPNEAYLEYSNNPNNTNSTGNTPKDKVTVFTYGFIVNKVETRKDDNGNEYNVPLSGATFKLEKRVNNAWVDLSSKLTLGNKEYEGSTIENCVFTWTGLDDGIYKLTETKAPSGFNGVDPIEFTVTAEHEILSDDPRLTALLCNNENITVVTSNGVLTGELITTVVNEQGVVLPETGGTGNTVMYIMGSLLVLGAGVVLVSKRRMTGK